MLSDCPCRFFLELDNRLLTNVKIGPGNYLPDVLVPAGELNKLVIQSISEGPRKQIIFSASGLGISE